MPVSIHTAGTYTVDRVSNADSLTGWGIVKIEGSGGTPSAISSVGSIDLVREGTNAVASVANKQRVLLYFTDAAGYDFTAGGAGTGATKVPSGIAYMWAAFLAAGSALLKANGGMQLALGDGTNTSYWNIAGSDTYSGGFIKFAALTTVTPNETSGTAANLGDITDIGLVCDVGGTTTRFDNMVVDAIDVGSGLTFQGATANDALFLESAEQDEVTAIGVLEIVNGIIFAQGNIEFFATSAKVSIGETLIFKDTIGGAYTYQFDVTGNVTLTNSNVGAAGLVDFNFDTSGASTFAMTGGAVTNFNSLTTAAAQTMSGIVFQAGGVSTVANTISSSAFNQCGQITVIGELDNCTINQSTATSAVVTTNLSTLTTPTFIKDTANSHAVEVTTVGAGAMTWDGVATGYDAGTAASPITPTSTGNETIYLNFTSAALFTINIADGATIPSVRVGAGFTGTVNVVAGQKTFAFTVAPSFTGYEWRIYTVTAEGSMAGAVEIAGEETATLDNQSISHDYTGQAIAVQIISATYEESITYYTVDQTNNVSVTLNLTVDEND